MRNGREIRRDSTSAQFHLTSSRPTLKGHKIFISLIMSFQPEFSGPASNFPPREDWKDWLTLFNLNKPEMSASGDTDEDIGCIFNAIKTAAKIGVEERVILAIIMQESSGNVGAQTTNNGGNDAGLMQCQGSPGFPGQHGLSQVSLTLMEYHKRLTLSAGRYHCHGCCRHQTFQAKPRGTWQCRHSPMHL